MASPNVDIGTGITITFETSGFTAQILDVTPPGMSRESIDVTHQGTTGQKIFTPGDLYDPGELSFDIHFNPDTTPPVGSAAETITIRYPSGSTWQFTGFCTGYAPSAPLEDKMTGTVTVKVTGAITIATSTTTSTTTTTTTTPP